VGRILARFVDRCRPRRDDFAREPLDLLLERLLFGGEFQVHASACANRSKIGWSRFLLDARSSGSTRVSATTVMKFVSPLQRGTMWMCRWSRTPAPAARPRLMPTLTPCGV